MTGLETRLMLRGMNEAITGFLLSCDDDRYRAWWPGVHLRFHAVQGRPGSVGGVVFMDEYVGRRRLRMKAFFAVDEHAGTEFPRLAAFLGAQRPRQGG